MKKLKNITDYILENKKSKKINLSDELHNLKFESIKTFEEVQDIVKNSDPNEDKNKGFWLFKEVLIKHSYSYREYNSMYKII